MLHRQNQTELPRCSKCSGSLTRASLIPGLSAIAARTFECTRCGNIEFVPEKKQTDAERIKRSG